MQEKVDMAESIVTTFPVLKDPVTGGYVSICCIFTVLKIFVTSAKEGGYVFTSVR